ncbi:MAG: hypothetical protein FJX29_09050 [Alphaproteobacteria bacterium]|nr:hypothetical protein [Alphaproteobacteria bacterium]
MSVLFRVWFFIFALFGVPGLCASAFAGAFLQPPGEGQLIVTTVFESSDRFFDRNGRLRPVRDYRKLEMQAYVEYGALENVTIIAATAWSGSRFAALGGAVSDGFVRSTAGARLRLWHDQDNIISMQATLTAPLATEHLPPAFLIREVYESDVRLMYARRFKIYVYDGFANFESGYRSHSGRQDEWRVDATMGLHLNPRWTLIGQNLNIFARRYEIFAQRRSHKFLGAAIWRFDPRWALQFGVYHIPAGRNARQENGALASIWRRF